MALAVLLPSMTTQVPLVSAIIIFFNGERFLGEAIESVLAQSYDNLELLLVDDGSSDDSVEISTHYITKYPRKVKYLCHADGHNHGMSAARNLGVLHATGKYIAFLDADDVWLPDKITEQVLLIEANPGVAMIYGRTQIWHSWNPLNNTKDFFYPLGVKPDCIYHGRRMLGQLLENRFQSPTTCNSMLLRRAFLEVGGCEIAFRNQYEDQVFYFKLYLQHDVYIANDYWARYRQHEDNSGNHFDPDSYFRERAAFLDVVMRLACAQWSQLDGVTQRILLREYLYTRWPRGTTWAQKTRRLLKKFISRKLTVQRH
ncbi:MULTISPECIES: glycosyltransferase family 2 protein [Aphanothece]|uniref:glycosyltransferase family 2 protein n=1 Tax=Aphanothece TaxID=1121 RepID=UPI00398EBC40